MTGTEVTQPDPDGGVEMTDGEWAAFRGVEVTAAMRAEDVDAALVEKAAREVTNYLHRSGDWIPPQHYQIARNVLGAVLPEIQAQALEEARDMLVAASDRGLGAGHKNYARATRDAAAAVAQMARVARLTATTEEPTT